MVSRERILAALARRPPDRPPMWETNIWPETLARWRNEGLPAGADPIDYFGLDRVACVNDLFDPSPGRPVRTLELTADCHIYVDQYGKTVKAWLHGTRPPAIVEPGIRTREDWERVRAALTPGPGKFNNPAAEAQYHAARTAGHCLAITPPDPMWFFLYLTMGFEDGLRMMAKDPGLVSDMVETYATYLLGMLELTYERGYRFDALWFWSDLCYRNGLLFSPQAVRQCALPHWERLGQFAHEHGMRFIWHCDGNVAQLIPLLLEAGVDAVHPLEARAGNDVRAYKRQYGDRLCLIGNINADIVATNDPEAIEREVAAKVPVAAAGGGYIYNTDHSVPPAVSLTTYQHLLECVRRYGRGTATGG